MLTKPDLQRVIVHVRPVLKNNNEHPPPSRSSECPVHVRPVLIRPRLQIQYSRFFFAFSPTADAFSLFSLSLSLPVSVYLSLSACLSVCLSVYLSVSLSPPPSLPVSASVCLSVSVSLCFCLSASVCVCCFAVVAYVCEVQSATQGDYNTLPS